MYNAGGRAFDALNSALHAKSNDFVETDCERLGPLGQVRARTMFGGWGIYLDGRFCAIVHRDALYFKADDISRAEFEAKGLRPFKLFPDQATVMSYYDAPPLRRLQCDQGLEVGLRRAARKRPTTSVTCPRAPPLRRLQCDQGLEVGLRRAARKRPTTSVTCPRAPPLRRLQCDQGLEVGLRRAARKRPTTSVTCPRAPPLRRLQCDQGLEVGLRRAARKRPTTSVKCPRAPPEVFEDPAEMIAWGRKALEAALRSQKKKPAGRRER